MDMRLTGLVAALATISAAPVLAVSPDDARVHEVFARKTVPITARAHLIYKPDAVTPPFEGNVVVIEQGRGLVVVDAGGSPPPATPSSTRFAGFPQSRSAT